MIVNLPVSRIGERAEFVYGEIPMRGLVNITSLSEVITGTTGTKFFDKYFSIALDGVRYGKWIPLTLANLQAATGTIPIKNDLLIKFRYTRAGTDTTGVLTINSVVVLGTYSLAYYQVLDFNNTPFSDIAITDDYYNQVWINLLQKVYEYGIVPKFLLRGDNNLSDEDYVTIWKTIAYFYALPIALVDYKISQIFSTRELLVSYLQAKGMFLDDSTTLPSAQVLASRFLDEMRRRGTQMVVKQDGDIYTPNPDPEHGELLRLIGFDINRDEFLFEFLSRDIAGWNINNSSPLFYGLVNHLQLNKTPENTQDFVNLSLFTILGTAVLFTDGSKQVLKIPQGGVGIQGFETKQIKVDPSLAYEITFWVRRPTTPDASTNFEIDSYDEFGGLINSYDVNTLAIQNFFYQNGNQLSTSSYYFVRGIIYPYNTVSGSVDGTLNIGYGENLVFDSATKRVVIRIGNSVASIGNSTYIWDFKMKPLSTPYTNAFINSIDLANIWLKNRNVNNSAIELEKKIAHYLIPYSSLLKINYLP